MYTGEPMTAKNIVDIGIMKFAEIRLCPCINPFTAETRVRFP